MIGARPSAILGLIINHYIKTGEPMGSKTLCQMLPYSVSSATIRNEMAHLTDLGFLEQRHTSGGRVPTKSSFRYYVDNLAVHKPLTPWEEQKFSEVLSINASDPERLLTDGTKLLSDVTGCASFFTTVKDPYDCIQGVELIPAGNSKAMLVMLTVGGKIKSSVCKIRCPIDDDYKKIFYQITNRYFIGTPISDVDIATVQATAPFLGEKIFDMLPVLSSLCSLCKEASDGVISIQGETNLLSQTELGSEVYQLLSFLASKKKLSQSMASFALSSVDSALLIGEENPIHQLKNTSMAVGKFRYNNSQLATIGIIGSVRIDYDYILPRVDYIMKTISKLLKEGGVRYE